MAVQPSDLLEPVGDLSPEMFPGKDDTALSAMLTAYISDGAARVAGSTLTDAQKDQATMAWAYGRAYRNVLRRLSRTPASFSLANEGSQTMLGEQIRTFKSDAVRWESEFDTITGSAPTPDETPSAPATNAYTW